MNHYKPRRPRLVPLSQRQWPALEAALCLLLFAVACALGVLWALQGNGAGL